ncbi:MAG: ATP-binding protein [Victivallales bacterium]
MYNRKSYIDRIRPFIDKPAIKVLTGMRRVGKSCLLKLVVEELESRKIPARNIIFISKESLDFDFIRNYTDLNRHVRKMKSKVRGRKYLFIDEVQEIENWEKAIASFFAEGDFDIYITGSNAHLLSSELATLLSGRYVEIPVYSLSFSEFLLFRGEKSAGVEKEFLNYLHFGGLPAIHYFDLEMEPVYQYINSIYDTILLKDVIQRNSIRNPVLLQNIGRYIFDNIGNIFSAKRISDYIKSQNLRINVETVQNYVNFFLASFAVYKVPRYDIKGKRLLEIHEKYFLGDIGFRHALMGYREKDISGILENIVFLELKRRGYNVFIGKLMDYEIDFVAEKAKERIYVQSAYLLASAETVKREFLPLSRIPDNYPKYVISMDTAFGEDRDGIKRLNIIDFLLGK